MVVIWIVVIVAAPLTRRGQRYNGLVNVYFSFYKLNTGAILISEEHFLSVFLWAHASRDAATGDAALCRIFDFAGCEPPTLNTDYCSLFFAVLYFARASGTAMFAVESIMSVAGGVEINGVFVRVWEFCSMLCALTDKFRSRTDILVLSGS